MTVTMSLASETSGQDIPSGMGCESGLSCQPRREHGWLDIAATANIEICPTVEQWRVRIAEHVQVLNVSFARCGEAASPQDTDGPAILEKSTAARVHAVLFRASAQF